MDLVECCNNLYEYGIKDDRLALLYEGMRENDVAVNSPVGQTDRMMVPDIVGQGGALGPACCSVTIDDIGKEAVDRGKHQYVYKGNVSVPMLSMVDDLLAINKCGVESVEANAFINAKFESKTLTLNASKCHKIHIGPGQSSCPQLHAHNDEMELVVKDKYLGDIIKSDGKHDSTIQARVSSGLGQISALMTVLKEVSLGHTITLWRHY